MSEYTEYSVKLGNVEDKEYNIMRFKAPHKCDLEQLTNPRLERQEIKDPDENKPDPGPQSGEGSEYRQKEREDARKRRRGFRARKQNPADQPWILKEHRKGGKHFIGRKEGGINSSASYYLLSLGPNNSFEAYPVANWYNFAPPVKYNYLNDEEAEERFEKRHKTMNYFSIMVSKRIKEKTEDESSEAISSASKQARESDDSEAEFSSVGSDTEDVKSAGKKGKSKGTSAVKKKRKPSTAKKDDSEAGEETDEGDMESQEMDYFSTSSSDSDVERQRKAVQEQPRDDAEVERKEEGGIDAVFAEKSSSEDEEGEDLTESGKELKAIIRKQIQENEENEEEEDNSSQATPSPVKGIKREAESASPSPSVPSAKKAKVAEPVGPTHITADEVVKYLSRKPMTVKALMKKFIKLKPAMSKSSITTTLAEIVKSQPQIESHKIDKKTYLLIRNESGQ